ncbi:MAG: mechanosensitive ion channel domain-containing protein [Cyanobacteria bacterium P01_H01_bin.121]
MSINSIINTTFYGSTILQWIAALTLIVFSLIFGRIIYYVFRVVFGNLAKKTESDLDDKILDAIEEPITFIIIVLCIRLSLAVISLPEAAQSFANSVFLLLAVGSGGWLLSRLYAIIHDDLLVPIAGRTKSDLDDQILPILKRTIQFAIWFLTGIIGLNNAGIDVGAVLASLGIGGVAFALASQDTISNLFGGITILLQRKVKIGDLVEFEGARATIKEIGLRTTTLQDFSYEHDIIVPNQKLIQDSICNINARSVYWTYELLHLHYQSSPEDIKKALSILRFVTVHHPQTTPGNFIFDRFGDYAFDLRFSYEIRKLNTDEQGLFISETNKIGVIRSQVNLSILKLFRKHNIRLALPVQMRIPTTFDSKF